MPVGSHNILSKVDRAIVAYLLSVNAGNREDVFPAKSSLDKPLPCTVVFSERATLIHPYSGVYEVLVSVLVKTDPCIDTTAFSEEEPKETSEDRVTKTFDALSRFGTGMQSGEQLAQAITASARSAAGLDLIDFTVQDISVESAECGFGGTKLDVWIDTLNLKVLCCPASVE